MSEKPCRHRFIEMCRDGCFARRPQSGIARRLHCDPTLARGGEPPKKTEVTAKRRTPPRRDAETTASAPRDLAHPDIAGEADRLLAEMEMAAFLNPSACPRP